MSRWNNQNGLGVIETIIALGVTGLVALVVISLQVYSQKSISQIERYSNVTSVIIDIQKSITDNDMYLPAHPAGTDLRSPNTEVRCYSDKGDHVPGVTDINRDQCWYLVRFIKTEVRDRSFASNDQLSQIPISRFLFEILYYKGNRAEMDLQESEREGRFETLKFSRLKTGHITE